MSYYDVGYGNIIFGWILGAEDLVTARQIGLRKGMSYPKIRGHKPQFKNYPPTKLYSHSEYSGVLSQDEIYEWEAKKLQSDWDIISSKKRKSRKDRRHRLAKRKQIKELYTWEDYENDN